MPTALSTPTSTPTPTPASASAFNVVPHASAQKRAAARRRRPLYWFALPAVAVYGLFFVVPTFGALYYSFFNWEGPGTSPAFVDIENYKTKILDDTAFQHSAWVSLKFMVIVVIFQTLLALGLSLMLTRNTRGTIFLRSLYFFPTILASSAVAFVWNFVYDPTSGLITTVLDKLGISYRPALLGSPKTALVFLAVVQVWFHAGQMMVVFVAGLQQIPKDYIEAAEIDGASRWQRFRSITWPLLGPATGIVVAYTTLQSFRAFDLVYIMTEGGPLNSTQILGFHIYRTAFQSFSFGEAAAESVLFMILIASVTFLQRRVLRFTNADISGGTA